MVPRGHASQRTGSYETYRGRCGEDSAGQGTAGASPGPVIEGYRDFRRTAIGDRGRPCRGVQRAAGRPGHRAAGPAGSSRGGARSRPTFIDTPASDTPAAGDPETGTGSGTAAAGGPLAEATRRRSRAAPARSAPRTAPAGADGTGSQPAAPGYHEPLDTPTRIRPQGVPLPSPLPTSGDKGSDRRRLRGRWTATAAGVMTMLVISGALPAYRPARPTSDHPAIIWSRDLDGLSRQAGCSLLVHGSGTCAGYPSG